MNICKNIKLLRLAQCFGRQYIHTPPPYQTAHNIILEPLKNRELIRIKGDEVVPFLQGLITNDITRLVDGPPSLYAMFLNKAGRVLYDTIVYRTSDPNTFLLECDKDSSSEFRRHLRTYRVRRRIDIDSVDDEYEPWVVFSENNNSLQQIEAMPNTTDIFIAPDPRLTCLGTRVLAPTGMTWGQLAKCFWRNNDVGAAPNNKEHNYKQLRYQEGVGEGVTELPPGKCFPLEANGDILNAISFNKGCYIGQELTARVHHSGVVRKRYMPLRVTAPITTPQAVKSIAGANLGTVFGHSGNRAVALLRLEQVLNGQQELLIDGEPCYTEKPNWWPSDLPQKRRAVALSE